MIGGMSKKLLDKNMKILMLGWELPPYNSGGLGVACYQLSRALAHKGVAIDFVLPPHAQSEPVDFMNIVTATPVETCDEQVSLPTSDLSSYTRSPEEIRSIQRDYTQFIDRYVLRSKPDIIHAHDWLTLEAGVRAKQRSGVPLVAHVHATEFDRAGGQPGHPLIHEIEQMGLLAADQIFAVSEATKQIIVREYRIPADKIKVVYNSAQNLPVHYTDMINYRYLHMLKQEGYTIVATIGRLTIQKGLSFFLEAAAKAYHRHGRMVFVIAGDGDQRNELIAMSADLGIADAVLFTGFVRGGAWRDVYNIADVFVMSSVSEPFGITALEAAQHTMAITLTNQSGVSEVLKNVLRYDFWDIDKLADQLIAVASSPALRHDLAANVGHEVSLMSWADTAQQLIHRYEVVRGRA